MAGKRHFELNGVRYFAAESAEGNHYNKSYQPLRPPNGLTIQGETSNRFQLRPDILQWSITDWSGGFGVEKFDPAQPNKHHKVQGRVFEKPGVFMPMANAERFPASLNEGVLFAADLSTLYAFDITSATMYEWDGSAWDAGSALTGAGAAVGVASDQSNVYLNISTGVVEAAWGATAFSSLTSAHTPHNGILSAGDYLYLSPDTSDFAVREVLKSDGTTVDIAYHTIESYHADVVAMDGKIYSMASVSNRGTEILEIVPTSAAGTGFGYQLALLEGFQATCMWQHSGILFLGGHDAGDQLRTSIMYVQPDGTYGSLGQIETATNFGVPFAKSQMNRWLTHYFTVADSSELSGALVVYEIDSVTGNMAMIAAVDSNVKNLPGTIDGIFFRGDLWFCVQDDTDDYKVYPVKFDESQDDYGRTSAYASFFETGWHDFGISGPKILSSLELIADDPMLNNWDITVQIFTDGDDTTSVDSVQWLENGALEKRAVSDETETISFQTLKLKLFVANDSNPQTVWPEIQALNAFVQVPRHQRVWELALDLSSDKSVRDGFSGKQRIENLETLLAAGNVFSFSDYYRDHNPGATTPVNVLIDECRINLSQPGEGVALVKLVEVA